MKDITMLPYLYESQEFQTFIRPTVDLEKALKTMPIQTTDDFLLKLRAVMPVNEVSNYF
jgi:hypothetical protein